MDLTNYSNYIDHIPGFMISAENVRLLKKSEYKSHIKAIVDILIEINNKIIKDIVFGSNESIIFAFIMFQQDFSALIIKILQNLGYNVNIVHVAYAKFLGCDYPNYSLIISI